MLLNLLPHSLTRSLHPSLSLLVYPLFVLGLSISVNERTQTALNRFVAVCTVKQQLANYAPNSKSDVLSNILGLELPRDVVAVAVVVVLEICREMNRQQFIQNGTPFIHSC